MTDRKPTEGRPGLQLKKGNGRLYRLPSRLTYAAVVNSRNEETEITELMIRRACDEMEKYQQFPFAPHS